MGGSTPLTVFDGSDSFGVGGTVSFGPGGITGAVTGQAGNVPTTSCPTCGTSAGIGIGIAPMLLLAAAVIIIAIR